MQKDKVFIKTHKMHTLIITLKSTVFGAILWISKQETSARAVQGEAKCGEKG